MTNKQKLYTHYALVEGDVAKCVWSRKCKTGRSGSEQNAVRKVTRKALHDDPKIWMRSKDFRDRLIELLPVDVVTSLEKHGRPAAQELKCISNFISEGWLRGRTTVVKRVMEDAPLAGWRKNKSRSQYQSSSRRRRSIHAGTAT